MKQIADALELLTAQHDAISVELARIPAVEASELVRALGGLADLVTTHLAVEEQFLSEIGIASSGANDELRLELAELLAMEMTSPELATRVAAFTQRWTAHAESQEQTIFIWLAETLAPAVLEDIGAELGARSAQSHCLAA
jgi:hemerythrin